MLLQQGVDLGCNDDDNGNDSGTNKRLLNTMYVELMLSLVIIMAVQHVCR